MSNIVCKLENLLKNLKEIEQHFQNDSNSLDLEVSKEQYREACHVLQVLPSFLKPITTIFHFNTIKHKSTFSNLHRFDGYKRKNAIKPDDALKYIFKLLGLRYIGSPRNNISEKFIKSPIIFKLKEVHRNNHIIAKRQMTVLILSLLSQMDEELKFSPRKSEIAQKENVDAKNDKRLFTKVNNYDEIALTEEELQNACLTFENMFNFSFDDTLEISDYFDSMTRND